MEEKQERERVESIKQQEEAIKQVSVIVLERQIYIDEGRIFSRI